MLANDIFWGGAMVIQLDYRLMPWTWNGLRSVIREANRQGNDINYSCNLYHYVLMEIY